VVSGYASAIPQNHAVLGEKLSETSIVRIMIGEFQATEILFDGVCRKETMQAP
jgi:hypothetical protein